MAGEENGGRAMSTSLMTTRRFAPLFWCQAFSAFGDNFLKTALVFLILFHVGAEDSGALIQLAGATLIVPFFFLSGVGGEMADRFDKAIVARRLKLFEIAVAALAVAGFAFHSLVMLFIAVFLYGVIASLFGPIKYGILPDHLAREELTKGNALVEGGTFLAILLGTIVAGIAAKDGGDPIHFAWLMMVSAAACWIASLFIPRTGEGAPNLTINPNIAASTISLIKYVRADRRLWWAAGSGSSAPSSCRCCRPWRNIPSAAPPAWSRSFSPFSRCRSRSDRAWPPGSRMAASCCCRR
jgi:acyl-[acyl-carrier-protein]-phospholipid O-acyltransferase / long-chain-fatty-acid--[acyl-carrier-protein] ligase